MKESTKVRNKVFAGSQTLGPSLVTGIAVIPLGGLLLGLGAMLSNATFAEYLPFLSSGFVTVLVTLFNNIGNMIINNLPIIFAMSVAMSYCKKDAVAPFSALLGFMAMHTTISQIMGITAEKATDWTRYATVLGIPTLNVGVLGGIICGLTTAFIYKKFKDIKLPTALSFFQGKRFVPLATMFACMVVAIPVSIIWPLIQNGIAYIGGDGSVELSIFVMATIHLGCMLLMPFGLHPLLYVVWAFQLGTYVSKSGEVVHGLQNIFLTQLSEGTELTTTVPLTANYLLGAALIGISIAFIKKAQANKVEETKSLLMGGIFTNLLTGITEPIFFTFVFSAPILYIIMALVVYAGEYLIYFLKTTVGTGYSGGLMDFFIYGVLQGAHNWWILPIVCLVIGVIMYCITAFLIKKRHLDVPGQESYTSFEGAEVETKYEKSETGSLQFETLKALGGCENVVDIDACATRLRVQVKEAGKVEKKKLKALGATGVMEVGNNFQIVFGTKASSMCEDIKKLMENNDSEIEEEGIVAPMSGNIIPLKEVKDEVFSSGMVGTGFAIVPDNGNVYSPISGVIQTVFPTKHAIGILSEKGKEVLIHIGLDTVKLKGEPFTIKVKEGEKVCQGDLIAIVDLDKVRQEGYDTTTVVAFANIPKYNVKLIVSGKVKEKQKKIIDFVK